MPLATVVTQHTRATLLGTFAMVACYAVFYLSTVFALGYGTATLGYTRPTFLLFECNRRLLHGARDPALGARGGPGSGGAPW